MTIRKLLIIGIFIYIPFFSFGQPTADPCDDPDYAINNPAECNPVETPLDDGVVLLIAAGALFALKNIKFQKHKQQAEPAACVNELQRCTREGEARASF